MSSVLDSEKSKFDYFIVSNGDKTVDDVKWELRRLVNEIIDTTWRAAGESMRADLLRQIG